MARVLVLALAFSELATGTQYVDYSDIKMSQYGGGAVYEGPRDEYSDRSPDMLSASQDYRDEDEFIGRTEKLSTDIEETEIWHEVTQKHERLPTPVDDGDIDTLDKYSPEEMVPKFKSANRFAKHKSLKIRDFEREDIPRMRPLRTHSRRRGDAIKDKFHKFNSDDFHHSDDRKRGDLHDDSIEFNRRGTTARIIRRKPRDRFEKPQPDDEDPLANLGLNLRNRDEFKVGGFDDLRSDTDFRSGERPSKIDENESDNEFHKSAADLMRPSNEASLFSDKEEPGHKRQEYSDYYDMKRVHSIKNKLPQLLRKSTELPPVDVDSMFKKGDVPPFRRVGGEPFLAPLPNAILRDETTTSTIYTTTLPSEEISRVSKSTDTIKPIIIDKKTNLSLAEKSKLSILKSLKKDSGVGQTSTKPPVLLQVTNNRGQTIVIVEPPTTPNPWLRARLVSDDSPEMIEKVKRLMRQKLIAKSKSLRELTDDWDSMICDYIDTSLLNEDVQFPDYSSSVISIDLCTHIVYIVVCFHLFLKK